MIITRLSTLCLSLLSRLLEFCRVLDVVPQSCVVATPFFVAAVMFSPNNVMAWCQHMIRPSLSMLVCPCFFYHHQSY
jgi:hypothetical protein